LYAHLLYGRDVPSHVLRTIPEGLGCDLGIQGAPSAVNSNSSTQQKKRKVQVNDDYEKIAETVAKVFRRDDSKSSKGEDMTAKTNNLINIIKHYTDMIDRCDKNDASRIEVLVKNREKAEKTLETLF
jgi:uncharacterized protein YjcR